jgi:hypothetical protein
MRMLGFRLRTLLIAVAVACLPLGWISEALYQRRDRYTGIADNYAREMMAIERDAAARSPGWLSSEGYRRTKAWHEQRRIKWERAARYPWLPVEPDSQTLP